MRYPAINDHPTRKVGIPQLSGGINKTDNPSYINDNQLTECNNMWFASGRLRTRPGFVYRGSNGPNNCLSTYSEGSTIYTLSPNCLIGIPLDSENSIIDIGNEDIAVSGFITRISEQQQGHKGGEIMMMGTKYDGELVLADWNPEENAVKTIEPYIPTVKINVDSSDPDKTPSGYMYQGYNLLSNSYKIACNTHGGEANGWAWILPSSTRAIKSIDIEYYDLLSGEKQETTIVNDDSNLQNGRPTSEEKVVTIKGTDGNYLSVTGRFQYWSDYNAVIVECYKEATDAFICDEVIYSAQKHGLILTINCEPDSTNTKKISSMTMGRWFGGTRGGLNNGTRLFVAGGEEEGIIRWSDLNRPNYFSENTYAYVGDGSKITALAQQDDMLVIFQEHAITYAVYVEGAQYTAEDIQNENVVDITALSATFPLTTIHPEIGCDCPDTVQLCNNRLVWLTSDGKVYCLVNNNQYNERNVREISYSIESLLKKHTTAELKSAKSADAGGMYFLFVGDKGYVLDYGNTSFEYYTYYSHEKKMKNYLSWYMWTLPEFFNGVVCAKGIGDRLCVVSNIDIHDGAVFGADLNTSGGYRSEDQTLDPDTGDNKKVPIPCLIRTKLFAFSGADRMKRIPNCNISLCKIPGEVDISFITDNGSGEPRHILVDEEVGEDNPDAVKRMTFYPNAAGTCLFGIDIRSDSAMAIESIAINYKEMGVHQ